MKQERTIILLFTLHLFACNNLTALDQATHETIKNVAETTVSSEEATEKAVGSAANMALEGAKLKLKAILSTAFAIGGLCNITREACKATKAVKDYYNPSTDQNLQKLNTSHAIEYYKKKKEFRECLIKHAQGRRNWHGRPKECEQLARMLKMLDVDSENDLKEMTAIYKKARKKYSHSFL